MTQIRTDHAKELIAYADFLAGEAGTKQATLEDLEAIIKAALSIVRKAKKIYNENFQDFT